MQRRTGYEEVKQRGGTPTPNENGEVAPATDAAQQPSPTDWPSGSSSISSHRNRTMQTRKRQQSNNNHPTTRESSNHESTRGCKPRRAAAQ